LDKPQRLEVTFIVSRWDVISMYLGSWGARMSGLIGAVLIAIAILSLPSGRVPLDEKIGVFGLGLACAILGPLGFVWGVTLMYGTRGLVGKKVHLNIDDSGVRGWPLAPYQDRSWPRVRKARRLRGVITLPFRQFGTRAGWVLVPERALSAEQLMAFRALLASKGLMKAAKPKS
jgi:hypothetical protein